MAGGVMSAAVTNIGCDSPPSSDTAVTVKCCPLSWAVFRVRVKPPSRMFATPLPIRLPAAS
ncbi:hypothetical protein D3C76_1573810 [compost metagenome]